MGPKKYRPQSIVDQGQLKQKPQILDLLGSHNIFFRTFTPNVRITVHLDLSGLGLDWIGWYPGGVKYGAPYGANSQNKINIF